jgi:signal transduction histidine kinase
MRAVPSFLDLVGRRLALRQTSREVIEVERILAVARLLLAISSLLAIYFDPIEPARYASITLILLLLYGGHSLALLWLSNSRAEISNQFALLVHVADVLWPALIGLFTNGVNGPFFFYFSFALLASAFRWGMRATLVTTMAAITIMVVEANLMLGPLRGYMESSFDLNGFILRESYLAIFGVLVGYLAESEKRRRAEALGVARISGKARVDSGLKGTMQATLQESLALFDAYALMLTAAETGSEQVYMWRTKISKESGEAVFSGRQLDMTEGQRYLFAMPEGCVAAAWRDGHVASVAALDEGGNQMHGKKCQLHAAFVTQHPYRLLLMGRAPAVPGLQVRLFLFEPRLGGLVETQLRILQDLINSVAPAVYNVYLLRRLRSRAAAAERGRVARELHDGVVQSLHAIAFRLYALRTAQSPDDRERNQELTDIQQLVQNETANLRALIRQLEPLDFDPRHLLDFLSRMIEQFRYDTGIEAIFVCDLAEVAFPARICRELAGIVREALANVLKHSAAQNVLVRLALQTDACVLTIEDDGRGFEFSGRMSYGELKSSRRGPLVIKERVRAIGGELTIESTPGQGARLEIKFPRQVESRIA